MQGVSKSEVLERFGYGGDRAAVEALLEAEGLSRPSRESIHPDKVERVQALLAAHFLPVCNRGDCRARAEAVRGEREPVPAASPERCAICGGSVIQRAVDAVVAACQRAGWRRLAVVGGSPNTRAQTQEAVAGRLELRLIDGTAIRNRKAAEADLAWADHVVVWGATQLAHKVSGLYLHAANTSSLNRRSVEELSHRVTQAARESAGGRRARG